MQIFSCVVLLVSFLVLLLAKLLIARNHGEKNSSSKLPPGPWQLPIIGSMHHLLGSPAHRCLRDLAKKYGNLMHLEIGEVSVVVVSSAEAAKEIMKTYEINFATRPKLAVTKLLLYGDNHVIFGDYDDRWRQLKKICMVELLSQKRVQLFQPIREEEISHVTHSIWSAKDSPVNLSKMLYSLSNNITSRIVIGGRYMDQESFYKTVNKASEVTAGRYLADVFPSWPMISVITGLSLKLRNYRKKLERSFNNIIREHRAKRAATKEAKEEDLVDVLLRLQEEASLQFPFTDDCIKGVMFDMISAGSETSANVLEWTMTELVKNPTVMKKAQSEVREVLGVGEKPDISEKSMSRLHFLKLVIKENLRLHPPAPLLLPRMCRETCEVLGFKIPRESKVMVNAWAIGRDPQLWEDPEEFKPERFEDSLIDFKGFDFELIPFGAGRRICPGISFGLATVEQTLSSLLYYFDWKLPDSVKLDGLDMTECFGITAGRKSPLMLCATCYATLPSPM